jgi:hypothetical protein
MLAMPGVRSLQPEVFAVRKREHRAEYPLTPTRGNILQKS